MHRFERKTVIVTGGASGIGRAAALGFAAEGARLVIADQDAVEGERTVALAREKGGEALFVQVDVSRDEDCRHMIDAAVSTYGRLDVAFNNAGVGGSGFALHEEEEFAFDRMIAINLKGPFLCMKEIVPEMLAAGWGRIINITSSSIQTGAPGMVHYVGAKSGLLGMTKALAVEYADKGITVNTVPPGFIDTPMLRASPVDVDGYAATQLMKRPGKPEDIAGAVAYLASDEAGYVTGQTISVNGGRYMGSA
jgi:2-hydroxycyclohexanecarboxyl-CoA dehydrogenase